MGIDAQLTDERGNILAEILDPLSRVSKLIPAVPDWESTRCIQYIDPYGDTIFNRLQMECFLEEWQMVEGLAADQDDKVQLGAVRALALRCKNAAHMYLKFIGD